ncbi:PilZ domain-containing protein [uncultured Psychromonas sp.]|uniref:PilZ domain-containing protein n=1 Tax=uncultured Psychromonas sp. TaxID=173974 RepID=UPI00260E7594|nr:PilZ domain-containing protein [uncultured Psychromonas sp.]
MEVSKIDNRELTRLNQVNCGEIIHLQIITATKPIRLKTRLIGVDPNMSVILAFGNDPSWIKALPHIKETNDVIVRFMNNDQQQASVVAFRSSIQKIMTIMGRWLVLDYPKTIESATLRQHRRVDVSVEASMVDSETKAVIANGVLIDLSIQGCAFVSKKEKSLTVGTVYELCIDLEEGSKKICLSVALKNINNLNVNDEVQCGLVFMTPETEAKASIQELLLHHLQK